MKPDFDEYYIEMTRYMLGKIEPDIEKAQTYAAQAGFREDMTIQVLLKKLLKLNQRIIGYLLDYMQIAEDAKR
jgi:hypothetical protein